MTRRINSTLGSVGLLVVVIVLWVVSLAKLQLSAIGSYGLMSALPGTMYAGLAVLTVSMVLAIHRGARQSVLVAHLVLFVFMVHGTPAIVYGTLRYAWAWKHLGIVDFLVSHHAVNPSSGDQLVYQNWPGFFTASTSWLAGSGLKSWTGIAQWAPPTFELLWSFAVLSLLRTVEADRRLAWLAVWFFVIGNWVGQDYFSPQAFAYFLYLAVLVVIFRWLARRPAMPSALERLVRNGLDSRLSPFVAGDPDSDGYSRTTSSRDQTRSAVILVLLFVTAIATSHPLTPMVLLCALFALAITGVLRVRTLPIMAVVPIFLWLVTGARSYTRKNSQTILSQFGALEGNVTTNLSKASHAVPAQHIVSTVGRAEVVFIALLAGVGVIRRIRSGSWDLAMMVLAVVPVAILAGGSYGGEAIFRVYLFALPFLAYFAAAACYPSKWSVRPRSALFALAASAVVLSTFLFAYYGKEQWAYFTHGEVLAAQTVFDNAPPNSLLVEGTPDFPTHFANYTNFTYVDISSEPPTSQDKVLAHPAQALYGWLSDARYTQAYLIITASQKAETEALGELPPGSLDKIEQRLLADSRFKVLYHDKDAVVFTVPRPPGTQAAAVTP
jgi:hypothetical protein